MPNKKIVKMNDFSTHKLTCISHKKRVDIQRDANEKPFAIHRNGHRTPCQSSLFDIGGKSYTAEGVLQEYHK